MHATLTLHIIECKKYKYLLSIFIFLKGQHYNTYLQNI